MALISTAWTQANPGPHPTEPPVDAGHLRAFIELVRSDIRTEKTLIIAQNMQFTADEAVAFWALHSVYNNELNKLLDQRLEMIEHYVGTFKGMSDKEATDLAGKVFD